MNDPKTDSVGNPLPTYSEWFGKPMHEREQLEGIGDWAGNKIAEMIVPLIAPTAEGISSQLLANFSGKLAKALREFADSLDALKQEHNALAQQTEAKLR